MKFLSTANSLNSERSRWVHFGVSRDLPKQLTLFISIRFYWKVTSKVRFLNFNFCNIFFNIFQVSPSVRVWRDGIGNFMLNPLLVPPEKLQQLWIMLSEADSYKKTNRLQCIQQNQMAKLKTGIGLWTLPDTNIFGISKRFPSLTSFQ